MSTPLDDIIDNLNETQETFITIDVDEINDSSEDAAKSMITNLAQFYYDEEFMKSHPQIEKRIKDELETMRILIKMRKADEIAHDAIINAISTNNNNASLYKSLSTIQNTILSITTKTGEIVDRLNNMMKGYQLEIPFEKDEQSDKTTYRGTKEFIKQMICETENSQEPQV